MFAPLEPGECPAPNVSQLPEWRPIMPVPAGAPKAPECHPRWGKPAKSWAYRDRNGKVLFGVRRFNTPDGGKQILPLTFCEASDGRREWRWLGLPAPRPLYGLDRLAKRPDAPVLVVEGEKAADMATSLFPDHVVITSPNGAKAADKADWSPLAGRRVVMWPDNDTEGAAYAESVSRLSLAAGAVSAAVVAVPSSFPAKWDLADDLPAGWDHERLGGLLAGARPVAGGAHGDALPLVWFHDIAPAIDAVDFVEGLLGLGGMSVTYGESNSGKTFFACDLALHVALGWEWFGRQIDGGGVIYVAAEGGFGIRNRVAAFRLHHGLTAGDAPPFAIVPTSVNLRDPDADTDALIAAVNEAAERIAVPVRLVVIDTLSRAMAGGNENASEDMGAVVTNADRVRQATGAHLMFIHHSGKDVARGARGHSLLRAATDTEIEVARDHDLGISSAKVTKQRDLPLEGEFSYRLETVELGTNQRGKAVTSCVVLQAEEGAARKPVKLSDAQRRALDQLKNCLADHGEIIRNSRDIPAVPVVRVSAWREALKRAGVTDNDTPSNERSQFKRIREALANKGILRIWDDFVWLTLPNVTPRDDGISSRTRDRDGVAPPFRGATPATPDETDPFSLTD